MKTFLLFAFIITSQMCFSQKDGFESLLVGKNFFDKTVTDDFNLEYNSTDSSIFRLMAKLPKFICDEEVHYLDVEIDQDSTIKRVNLYTMGKVYADKNTYTNNFRNISQCMVRNLGKPDYVDNGSRNKDRMMTAGWRFPDLKIIFVVYTYDLPVSTNTVKKLFKMVWRVYDPNEPKTSW